MPELSEFMPSTRTRPRTRIGAALALIVVIAAMLVAPAGPAAAETKTTTLNFSGSTTLQSRQFNVGCDGCIPLSDDGVGVKLTASVKADWQPTASITHQYSASKLRQGQTLDLVNKLTPGSGPLTLTWGLNGKAGVYNFTGSGAQFPDAGSEKSTTNIDLSVTESTSCPLKLDGDGTYACSATHTFTVIDEGFQGLGVKVLVPLTTSLQITPDGVITVRSVTMGTGAPSTRNLEFHGPSPATVADPLVVPCEAVPGDSLVYDLTSSTTSPSYASTTKVNIKVDLTVIFTVNLIDETVVTVGPDSGTMTLTAPSAPTDLGSVLANNIPPTIVADSAYSGNEGRAIQFDSSATTSVCPGGLTHVWEFSDGGKAYGDKPFHTFADDGTYSGLLTVSDSNGNTARKSFSVEVGNLAPVANAGPNTAGKWGRDLAFNGSAVDPSPIDQGTLAYTWDFGDGGPPKTIADGGSSTTHAYARPGTYVATLTVCDKDGACSNPDTRQVTIDKRDVTLSYLGATSGRYDTPATLSASLVDEFGSNVNDGAIAFAVDGTTKATAGTNSSGIASDDWIVDVVAGSHPLQAAYAGNALYNAATRDASFLVRLKDTSVTYTGAVSGGPNKTITLSGIVKDASGTPLPGVTVNFQLGTQSATATTDANGIAATSLKLNQKNGTYTVTASYDGTPGRYAASATSTTFKLQVK